MNEIIAELEKLKTYAAERAEEWHKHNVKLLQEKAEQVQINRTLLQRFEESQADKKTLQKKHEDASNRAAGRLGEITKLHEQRQSLELELEKTKRKVFLATSEKEASRLKERLEDERSRYSKQRQASHEKIKELKEACEDWHEKFQGLYKDWSEACAKVNELKNAAKAPGYIASGYELVCDSNGSKCVLPDGLPRGSYQYRTLYLKAVGS